MLALVHNIVIYYFCTFQNGQQYNSSYDVPPYKDSTQLLTIFLSLWVSLSVSDYFKLLTS